MVVEALKREVVGVYCRMYKRIEIGQISKMANVGKNDEET